MDAEERGLPQDIDECHAIIQQHEAEIEKSRAMIAELVQEMDVKDRRLKRLRHQLEKLLRWRYGPKSEKIDPRQAFLFALHMMNTNQDVEIRQEKTAGKQPRRSSHGRNRLPKDLQRHRQVHDVPEEKRRCPQCTGELRHIGEDTSEQLEYSPARWYVIKHVRQKYACPKGCTVVTAEKPMQPIEKGLAGPGLLAHVAVSKYADHQPLHRQEVMFARDGITLSRKTLCGWMRQCAEVMTPLFEEMKKRVISSKAMQTDDTPVGVLDPELTRTRKGRIWTYVGDEEHPYTVYDYTPNRKREGPEEFMKGFEGYLQADAYSGYDALYKDPQRNVTEVACWAHARRKFYEAQTSDLMRSMVVLAYVRMLYEVEREARDCAMDGSGRLALRREKSVPILKDIEKYLIHEKTNVLPKSPIGEAIGYALGNWQALVRYCEDGDLEIDNNGAERSLRGIAVGRKNWMFFGSDRGGRTAAILTSFMRTCKRHRINPYEYMRDVLTRISAHPAKRIEELLPDQWEAARAAAPP
jgi:transposase